MCMREGAWRVRAGLLCLYVGWLKHELAFQAGCSVIVCQCRVRFFPLLVLLCSADQRSAICGEFFLISRILLFYLYHSSACLLGWRRRCWLAGRSCAFRLVDGAMCGVVTSTTFWLSFCAACLVLALPVLRACPCCCCAELVPSQSLVPSHVLVHLQNPRADIFICRKS